MRLVRAIVTFVLAMAVTGPAMAQVVLDMPAPRAKSTTGTSEAMAAEESPGAGIAGYDTYEEEPLYVGDDDVALFRYAGFRNFPRVTSVPAMGWYGGYMNRWWNDFNGPWVYPPIWGGWFFTNHGFGGFPHFGGHHHHNHRFHHFGGFHGHFRWNSSNFRGHVHIGF